MTAKSRGLTSAFLNDTYSTPQSNIVIYCLLDEDANLPTFRNMTDVGYCLFVQMLMLMSRHGSNEDHVFSSDPVKWPFMEQNIIYWIDFQTNVSHSSVVYALFFTVCDR